MMAWHDSLPAGRSPGTFTGPVAGMANRSCAPASGGLFGLSRRAGAGAAEVQPTATGDAGSRAAGASDTLNVSEVATLQAWTACIRDTRALLRDLQASVDAYHVRDESLIRVVSTAMRTLSESRARLVATERAEDFQAEAGMLAQLDTRLQNRVADSQASAKELDARVERLAAALDQKATAADAALTERGKAASEAVQAAVGDLRKLMGDARDWQVRAVAAESELERVRGELDRLKGGAGAPSEGPSAEEEGLHLSPTHAAPRRNRQTREPGAPVGVDAPRRVPSEEDAKLRSAAESAARSAVDAWQAFDDQWSTFCISPPRTITLADIPLPDIDMLEQLFMSGEQRVVDAKRLRSEWHPDKFMQRFGARLAEGERDDIMRAITEVAGRINALGLV